MFGCWQDNNLGYDPRYGGLAVQYLPDGSRICYQGGNIVSCEDEDTFAGQPVQPAANAPPDVVGPTGGIKCPPGMRALNGACVPEGGAAPPTIRGQDLAACLAYVAKYRRIYRQDPPGVWCLSQAGPLTPPPPIVEPPYVAPPAPPVTPSPSTGPIYGYWHHRRRRPRVTRPWVEKPKPPAAGCPAAAELCPIRGYVSCPIPGVDEYQNFRCTPGQPVVIDPGLQAVGAAEARARHGLSGFDDTQATMAGLFHEFLIGNIAIPPWLPIAALAGVAIFFLGRGKRK